MSDPVVSVVLPCFNSGNWLRESLSSISSAARKLGEAFEIVVIDDGSTDRSATIAAEFLRDEPSAVILRNERNIGIVGSLNRGLDVARGQYVARMDADDICDIDRLSRQLAFLRETGCDICGSWFVEFGQGPARTVRWPHTEPALRAAMLFQNTLCHPTVMARREVFDRYRYREEYALAEDYDLFGRALREFRAANVPTALLRYRRHPGQATQARREAMESITRKIRLEVLEAQGIAASPDERRVHNMIRSPRSIQEKSDLLAIESWLVKLFEFQGDEGAKRVVASQWTRACIRAAPLGLDMLRTYRASSLALLAHSGRATTIDLGVLALIRLDYGSRAFSFLRRAGLSA